MFEALLGTEMPLALRFFIAFVVVLGLIGAAAYFVRRFGVDRLGVTTARGRQPRLAVIDAAAIDGRRRLVLIRRDNVEHLLMIGGPTDVVVEPNIVRAQPASARESAAARAPIAADPHPRPMPIPEAINWPAEPATRPTRSVVAHEETIAWPRQAEPVGRAEPPAPIPDSVVRIEPAARAEPMPKQAPVVDPLADLATELTRSEPRVEAPAGKSRALASGESTRAPTAPPAPAPAGADQNLAEMAQRLEAALRRPLGPREVRPSESPAKTSPPAAEAPVRPIPLPDETAAGSERKAAPAEPAKVAKATKETRDTKENRDAKKISEETKPAEGGDQHIYKLNLEQEMASLLGRSVGKS